MIAVYLSVIFFFLLISIRFSVYTLKPLPDATVQHRSFINTHNKERYMYIYNSLNVQKWQLYAYQLQYREGIF